MVLEVFQLGLINRLFTKTKPVDIKFCEKNLDRHLTEEAQAELMKLSTKGKINIKEYECLSHCERCRKTFYALIDGQYVEGEPLEVVHKIQEKTQKNQA